MTSRRHARYYPVARVAHLERLASMAPADFLYSATRQDWDPGLAANAPGVERIQFVDVVRRIAGGHYSIVEIPEPLAIPLLPRLAVLAVLARINNLLRPRRPVTFVFYAIENLDQTGKLRSRLPVPKFLARTLINLPLRLVMSATSRAAFGTRGALDTYVAQLGEHRWRRLTQATEVRMFVALSPAGEGGEQRDARRVGFLGSFEERKGIRDLIAAWPAVLARRPDAELEIIGHGPLEDEVRTFVSSANHVRLAIDPPRAEIKSALPTWHVLVLLSRRTPTWREQIGLPILEGLSAGCEILTTSETGIAQWLETNGHRVVEPGSDPARVAAAIVEAIGATRPAAAVRAQLPRVDGRVQADHWMFKHSSELQEGVDGLDV